MTKRSEASKRGYLGAMVLHSQYSSVDLTRNAREKFLQRFEDMVDPERALPEDERHRRAEYAKRAYFAEMAAKSAAARKARKLSKGA